MFEAIVCFSILFFSLTRQRTLFVLKSIGILRLSIVFCMVTLCFWGQFRRSSNSTFPFPTWAMYTDINPKGNFISFDIVLEDGEKMPLPFHKVIRTPAPRAFVSRLNRDYSRVRSAVSRETSPKALARREHRLYENLSVFVTDLERQIDKKITKVIVSRNTIAKSKKSGKYIHRKNNVYEVAF
jgi:hypothetical protein